jgi:ribosomal RNA-processing protein 36
LAAVSDISVADLSLAEQKKLAQIDRFQNMSSKQREHTIERRRKKVTSKEKRNLPERRGI